MNGSGRDFLKAAVAMKIPCPQGKWPARRRRWLFVGGQWVATGIAISGVLCNNARLRWCFPLWMVSNGITLAYHVKGRLWGLAVRDVVFFVLAVIGWFMWG